MYMKYEVTVTSRDGNAISETTCCSMEDVINEIESTDCNGFSSIEIRRK